MFEKVNRHHPDKVADRIAGRLVDYAYSLKPNPKIAVEVLLGHGLCTILAETDIELSEEAVRELLVERYGEDVDWNHTKLIVKVVSQDEHLADNQKDGLRCGDNGIFKGMPITLEQEELIFLARKLDKEYDSDGKYIIDGDYCVICQSKMTDHEAKEYRDRGFIVNPLGYWTGGIEVDSGATNRKLGSDLGDAVTGGGVHGKDLSKADVSVNIYCHMIAQLTRKPVTARCAIGDESVRISIADHDDRIVSFDEIVREARKYVNRIGGFERLAEWGLLNLNI